MKSPRMKVAKLDDASLRKLQSMEEEFKVTILALEPQYPLAKLNEDQVKRLQSIEKDLGVVLLAYQS